MTVPADLINLALDKANWKGDPVGDPYEGTPIARVALRVYGQTRDHLFGSRDWDFLRKEVSLGNPIKTAPPGGYSSGVWDSVNNPPPPWIYEYLYPDLCVQIRSLRPTPIFIPEFTPQVIRFVSAYDTPLNTKVVLTNLYQPLAVITGQVNDPNEWKDSNFTEALVDALAVQFVKAIAEGDIGKVQLSEKDALQTEASADGRRG